MSGGKAMDASDSRYRAKITSKGQVTIPAAVRERYGLEAGDWIVLDPQKEYVEVRKEPTPHEYLAALRAKHPSGPARFASDEEALADYYRTTFAIPPTGPGYVVKFTRKSVDAVLEDDDEGR
jgi:AbrB family looped-hinge helix DNA binding protein